MNYVVILHYQQFFTEHFHFPIFENYNLSNAVLLKGYIYLLLPVEV